VVDDGFWLDQPVLNPGSVVHYRYRTGSGMRTGSFTVEPGPGSQFIYTGARPSDIEFFDMTPPQGIAPPPSGFPVPPIIPPVVAAWDEDWDRPRRPQPPPAPPPPAAEPTFERPSAY
jgi:hypothetical protein